MDIRVADWPHTAALQQAWRERLRREVFEAVLPWWRREMTDPAGGHHGGRLHDGTLRDDLPRSAVLGTRLLWTYAEASRRDPAGPWRDSAEHAWRWLRDVLWDERHEGVFWQVDAHGVPLAAHKQAYAQGFAIYALAAWHAAGGPDEALQRAVAVFERLEAHAHDPRHGGWFEGRERDWSPRADARLSSKEPAAAKSMNTLLHLLEGFTALWARWPQPRLRGAIAELLDLFAERVWQPHRQAFGLFFDAAWRPLDDGLSYGHDIEAAWLLVRAAQAIDDAPRLARTVALARAAADAVLARGVAADGSLLAAGRWVHGRHERTDAERHWWPQAEAMVGFWDAWQHGGRPEHARAAWRAWAWAEQHLLDPVGEWRKVLDARCRLIDTVPRAGPWECPYHHARACFELMDRLPASAE